MYTKEELIRQIQALGIKPHDTVMVHTSLKAVGAIAPEDGSPAHTYLSALRACVCDGLLLIPAHTWDCVRADGSLFDMRDSVPCTGAVSKAAVQLASQAYDCGRTDCVRSKHPSHSVVAFGTQAAEYVTHDLNVTTPCPWSGCTGRLYARRGKILLVGVGHESNTFFHAVDEFLNIPNRMRPNARCFTIRDYDKSCVTGMFYVHTGPFSENYRNYSRYLLQTGAVTAGRLGDAEVLVCDAVQCTHALQQLWAQADHDLCEKQEML